MLKTIKNNTNHRDLRSTFILPKINKDKKLYSLLVSILKILNLIFVLEFGKKNIMKA